MCMEETVWLSENTGLLLSLSGVQLKLKESCETQRVVKDEKEEGTWSGLAS